MGQVSFEDGRKEVVSLLQAGKEEFDKGNPLAGLSIIFEAQCVLSELFQREMEKAEGKALIAAAAGRCTELWPAGSDLLH
jgi:hypothetical protein